MPITVSELLPRVGHLVRVKISNPGDPSVPAKEWTARLERIWPDQGIADFHVGYTYLHVNLTDILSIEGGLQDPSTSSNPVQTVTL